MGAASRFTSHRRATAAASKAFGKWLKRVPTSDSSSSLCLCLSSENWKRPESELRRLMNLLEQFLVEERSTIMREGLRFATIGRREGLSDGVLREIDKTVRISSENTGMRLCLALNYGARTEIADAATAHRSPGCRRRIESRRH